MPTYEYECTNCGAVTEVFQSITESAKRRLTVSDEPTCDCKAPVKRRIGAGAGIIFKGSGFYQTDYRSESYKKAAKADTDGATGKGSKSTGGEKSTGAEKPTGSKSGNGKSGEAKSGSKKQPAASAKSA